MSTRHSLAAGIFIRVLGHSSHSTGLDGQRLCWLLHVPAGFPPAAFSCRTCNADLLRRDGLIKDHESTINSVMTTLLHLEEVQIQGTDGEKRGPGQYGEWHEAKSLTVYPQQFTCSTDKYATTSTMSILLIILYDYCGLLTSLLEPTAGLSPRVKVLPTAIMFSYSSLSIRPAPHRLARQYSP